MKKENLTLEKELKEELMNAVEGTDIMNGIQVIDQKKEYKRLTKKVNRMFFMSLILKIISDFRLKSLKVTVIPYHTNFIYHKDSVFRKSYETNLFHIKMDCTRDILRSIHRPAFL